MTPFRLLIAIFHSAECKGFVLDDRAAEDEGILLSIERRCGLRAIVRSRKSLKGIVTSEEGEASAN